MSKSVSVGLFYKHPLGDVGSLAAKVPFLPKTLANLVYLTTGLTVEQALANKVDTVSGKGLSTNDFTDEEKTKLSSLQNYTHPDSASGGSKASGLYKITTDQHGHISAAVAVEKSDITALGIPASDTTYETGNATTPGITKLYTATGSNTDGAMTQAATKSALDDKVSTSRKVNNKALSADITLDATDVSAVPTTRKVNNKALSADITLSATDVSAVPTTRKVNNKALGADITLDASDVSAVPTTRKVNNKALSADVTLSASDVSAVPTSRKVNNKALSADITLTASDVSAYSKTQIDGMLNGLIFSVNSDGILEVTYTA